MIVSSLLWTTVNIDFSNSYIVPKLKESEINPNNLLIYIWPYKAVCFIKTDKAAGRDLHVAYIVSW